MVSRSITTAEKIKALITEHNLTEGNQYKRYQKYYDGLNPTILTKSIQAEPDNRKAVAYARKAVQTVVGYMFQEIVYDYPDKNNEIIKMLSSEKGQIDETDSATIALSKGLSYKLIWKADNKIKYAVVKPENMIIEWDDKIEPEKIAAYYYTEKEIINAKGTKDKYITCRVYTADQYETWVSVNNNAYVLNKEESGKNESGVVNVAEHKINREKRNIFYEVIGLIDFQDEIVSSNMANEIQTIANSILALYGKYLDNEMPDPHTGETEQDKFMKAKIKIIDGLDKAAGDFIEWIVKTIQWEGIFGIFDRINDLIYDILQIPNMSNDKYFQDPSGEALKMRLTPFENKCSLIESNYKQGLVEQIKIMSAFPGVDEVDTEKLTITFNRKIPQSQSQRIDEAVKIAMMFGEEIALEYLGDIIPDHKKVLKLIRERMENEAINFLNNQTNVLPEPEIESA